MTPCQRYKQQLFDYIDNDIDVITRKEISKHLESCAECCQFVEQIKALRSRLKALPKVQLSDDFQAVLRERIRHELAGKKYPGRFTSRMGWRLAPVMAVVVVVCVSGYLLLNKRALSPAGYAEKELQGSVHHVSENLYEGPTEFLIDGTPNRIKLARSARSDNGEIKDNPADSSVFRENGSRLKPRLVPVKF